MTTATITATITRMDISGRAQSSQAETAPTVYNGGKIL